MSKETTPIPGPAGDIDLSTQEWRKENWVEAGNKDHPKAEAMAHAEDHWHEQLSRTKKEIDEHSDLAYKHRRSAISGFGGRASAHLKIAEGHSELAHGARESMPIFERAAARDAEDAGKKFDEEQAAEAAKRELGEKSAAFPDEDDERLSAEEEANHEDLEQGRRGEMYNS